MERRNFLLGALFFSAHPWRSEASNASANINYAPEKMLDQFRKEYLGRTYPRCTGLPVLGNAQPLRHRLSSLMAEQGYARFSADISTLADEDFAQGRLQIVDGWLLPDIEVELLA